MKKLIALGLLGAMLLSGCGRSPSAEPAPSAMPEGLAAPETVTALRPMPSPLVERFRETVRILEEGDPAVLYLTMESRLPRIYLPDSPEGSLQINTRMDQLEQSFWDGEKETRLQELPPDFGLGFDAFGEEAKLRYEENPEGFVGGSATMSGSFREIGKNLVSCTVQEYTYRGGPYGVSRYQTLVFDRATGIRLTLEDLSAEPEALKDYLAATVVEQALSSKDIQGQIAWFGPEEYEKILPGLIREGGWNLGENGLEIYSQDQELGPHSAGTVTFIVSYSRLEDLLKPEFVPEAPPAPEGTVTLASPEGCNARILDDLTLSDQGETLILSVKGRVNHVAVTQAVYRGEAGFQPAAPFWQASYMEDCALRLQAVLSEAAPNLMLRYEDGTGVHSYLITQSGKDGSYFLMDP